MTATLHRHDEGPRGVPGLFRLYFGDSEGNIFTATPAP